MNDDTDQKRQELKDSWVNADFVEDGPERKTYKAQRAVGDNTLGFLIPCHRVIRESGVIGNYRWGTERKVAMQEWEAGMTSIPPE